MTKAYRPYTLDQQLLLPPDMRQWLPEGDLALFMGHVALDGTKVQANASKHKAMSYARMSETEHQLEREVRALLDQAEQADAAEDAQYGPGQRGDDLPAELARRASRLAKIRAAKAVLEQQAGDDSQ